jgi:hypothetical protein
MPLISYELESVKSSNPSSTTGSKEGAVRAVVKSDSYEFPAQVYSEIVANRLAQFLGISLATGVAAKIGSGNEDLYFASLRVHEADRKLYDFTADGKPGYEDEPLLPGGVPSFGHEREIEKVCFEYPMETAHLAVFDLWIGNDDRHYNLKAEIESQGRGVVFAMDQGSSLLSCKETIDSSLEALESDCFPSQHMFKAKLQTESYLWSICERIQSMPDWAIQSAVFLDKRVGKVLEVDQVALMDVLKRRRDFLPNLIEHALLSPLLT